MISYWVSQVLPALLKSAGVWGTMAIITLAAVLFALYKAAQSVAAFLQRLIDNRDRMLEQLTRDMKASDERRAAIERETFAILASVNSGISQNHEAIRGLTADIKAHNDQSKQQFSAIQIDLAHIKGANS